MDEFIKNFRQVRAGVWECHSAADIQTSSGRVQVTPGMVFTVGTKFMNADIARMLDEEYSRGKPLADPNSSRETRADVQLPNRQGP